MDSHTKMLQAKEKKRRCNLHDNIYKVMSRPKSIRIESKSI